MSITDELREWVTNHYSGWPSKQADGIAIADRIDAEHEAALLNVHTDLMDARGWIRLPKDKDGEYIRVGDVMEGVDKYDSLKKVMGKVITVSFESDGTVDVAIQAWSSDGKSWHRAYLDPYASVYRHYHAPTVEDVLREFADAILEWSGKSGTVAEVGMWSDIAAEYIAKLQLKEDE